MLQDKESDRVSYQCAVGVNLIRHPWVYDVIAAANVCENVGLRDWNSLPVFMQRAVSLIRSERERLTQAKRQQKEAFGDSKKGMRAR